MARFDMGAEIASLGSRQPGPETYFELGIMYSSGGECPADLVAAHKWFNLAAVAGNSEAARYRAEVASEMTADAIAEAQRAAREWLRTH